MKKKILSIMLVIALVCTFLSACTGNPTTNEPESSETTTEYETNTDVSENTETSTDESETVTENDTDIPTEEPTEEPTETPTEEPEPHVHSYTESVTAATCTTDGVKTFTCDCGDSYTEGIKATGHAYGEYKYNDDATYSKDGTKTSTCANCGDKKTVTAEGTKKSYTFNEMATTMWATTNVNVRDLPSTDGKKLGALSKNEKVIVSGKCNETGWYRISSDDFPVAYVSGKYLTTEEPVVVNIPERYKGIEDMGVEFYIINDILVTRDDYDDKEYEDAILERDKAVAAAGYYEPVYWEKYDAYFMLIEDGADATKNMQELCKYIISIGGTPGSKSGGYFNAMCTDELIRVDLAN